MSPGGSLHKTVPDSQAESSTGSLPMSRGPNLPDDGEKNPPMTLPDG